MKCTLLATYLLLLVAVGFVLKRRKKAGWAIFWVVSLLLALACSLLQVAFWMMQPSSFRFSRYGTLTLSFFLRFRTLLLLGLRFRTIRIPPKPLIAFSDVEGFHNVVMNLLWDQGERREKGARGGKERGRGRVESERGSEGEGGRENRVRVARTDELKSDLRLLDTILYV